MKNVFVNTENASRFAEALTALERRGAQEACLMVVDGKPGLGKTTTLYRWAVQNESIYLRAKKEWTPGWFLADLLNEFRIQPAHSYASRFEQSMEAMLARQSMMAARRKTFCIIIDEADPRNTNKRNMERIRDFSDMGDIVFVLVGMGKIRDNLTMLPQVASRIAQYVRFEQGKIIDVQRFMKEICEVPVGEDLSAFIHQITHGYNREIKEAIANIERAGRRGDYTPEKPMRLADMAGKLLVNDRKSGQPICVPEVV